MVEDTAAEEPSIKLFHKSGKLKTLEEIELEVISFHRQHHGNNKTATAHSLGIARPTLYRKFDEIDSRSSA